MFCVLPPQCSQILQWWCLFLYSSRWRLHCPTNKPHMAPSRTGSCPSAVGSTHVPYKCMLGTTQRWETRTWLLNTLLHTAFPRLSTWRMRNPSSQMSTNKNPPTVWSPENFDSWSKFPTQRVDLYGLYLPNLPTTSCIWMTGANHRLLNKECML